MDKTVDEVWDLLTEYGIATQEELELVTCINGYNIGALNDIIYNGYNIDALDDIIYARTGYRDIMQLQD